MPVIDTGILKESGDGSCVGESGGGRGREVNIVAKLFEKEGEVGLGEAERGKEGSNVTQEGERHQ